MRLHLFSSFGDLAASLNAHYPQSEGEARAERDVRLAELQVFYESPIRCKCLA